MNEQPLKPFRWVGRPSEEELLGIPFRVPTNEPRRASRRAPSAPPPRTPAFPPPTPSRRRLRPREVLGLLAAVVVAALALGGAGNGVRFSGAHGLEAPRASDPRPARVTVAVEQTEARPTLQSDAPAQARPQTTEAAGKGEAPKSDATKDEPGPELEEPREEPAPPRENLLEADLPLLGTVTIEKPVLEPEDETTLADASELLPPELSLP